VARELSVWFHRTFSPNRHFSPGPFVPPPDPADVTAVLHEELERLRRVLDETRSEAERAFLAAEENAQARLSAEDRAHKEADERALWEQLAQEAEQERNKLGEKLRGEIDVHCDFYECLASFSDSDQRRIRTALKKLLEEPAIPGLRRHKVANEFISLSPTMGIKIITKMVDTKMVLFHVAPHDAADAWAERHKGVTAGSDVLELFPAVKSAEPKEATGEQATVYGQDLVKQILASGVPKEIADEFMWCSDEDDLLKRVSLMSEEWQEIIIKIACGQEVDPQEIPVKSSHIRPMADDPVLLEALTTRIPKWRLFLALRHH
jgi:hypothetical protein